MAFVPAIFADAAAIVLDTLGADATVTIAGEATAARVKIRRPQETAFEGFDDARQATVITAWAAWNVIEAAGAGDTIEQGGRTYRLTGAPLSDGHGLGQVELVDVTPPAA